MKPSPEQLEQLSAYLDGELPPSERAMVERQLAGDAELRRELESMRRAVDAVRALPRERAPTGLAAGVAARMGPSMRRERAAAAAAAPMPGSHWSQRVVPFRRYAVAAVILLAAGVGSWAFLGRGTAVHAPATEQNDLRFHTKGVTGLGAAADASWGVEGERTRGVPLTEPAPAPPAHESMSIARKDEKEDLRVVQIAGARTGDYRVRSDAVATGSSNRDSAGPVPARPMLKMAVSGGSTAANADNSVFQRGVSINCANDADYAHANRILANSPAINNRSYLMNVATQPFASYEAESSRPRSDVEEWTLGVTIDEACRLVRELMQATPSSVISGEQPGSSTTLPAADCDSLLAYFSADDGVVDIGLVTDRASRRVRESDTPLQQRARKSDSTTTAPASQSVLRRIVFRVVRPTNNATATETRGPANAP